MYKEQFSYINLYKLFCISCTNGSKKTANLLLNFDNSIKHKINKELYNDCSDNNKKHITEWLKKLNKNLDVETNKYNCFSFCV